MSTKYDDDIREAESQLVRDRLALVAQAEDLTARARDIASSPKGLAAFFAVGFILGEITTPRRPRKSKAQTAQTAEVTAKMGLGGLIGSALFAYARSRYGSPWMLGRSAWNYYAARQQARAGAPQARTPGSTTAAQSTVVRTARTPAGGGVGAHSPAAASSSPLRSPEHHAG